MEKVVGKDLEFWFDGAEIPIVSENLSTQFETEDSTDTATPATGKDFEIGRASRTFTIEANLYDVDSAEITTGTLVVGNRYRVTGGTITESGTTYLLGMLFESDGTGVATSTNKVKQLGSKINGKTMSLLFDSVSIPLTDLDINIKFDELDVTDTSTTGDTKETIVSRADRETKITGIVRDSVADILTTNPVKKSAVLSFNSNVKVTGFILPISKGIQDKVNEASKIDYSFKWVGFPAEQNFGLTMGILKSFKIILKRGTSTNKEYSGNAIITSKNGKCAITGLATITYTFSINGTLVENVAN